MTLLQDGTNHLKTPGGRECLFLWDEENDSLEIELAAGDPDSVPKFDIGLGRERDSGENLPIFFVLDYSVVVRNSSGSSQQPLSIFCRDEEQVRSFLKQPNALDAITSLFSNYGLHEISTTDEGQFSLIWPDWKPSQYESSDFISDILKILDRIAIAGQASMIKTSRLTDRKNKKLPAPPRHPLLSGWRSFPWLFLFTASSGYLSFCTKTMGLLKWLLDHLYLPLSLVYFFYFWHFHIRHYSIWEDLRRGKSEFRGIWGYIWAIFVCSIWSIIASLFMGFPLVGLFSFPVTVFNSSCGTQTLLSEAATITKKDITTDSSDGIILDEYSFYLTNNSNRNWHIKVSKAKYQAHSVGDSYPIQLHRGSLGILYFR